MGFLKSGRCAPWYGSWNTRSHSSHLWVDLLPVSFNRVSRMMSGVLWMMWLGSPPDLDSLMNALRVLETPLRELGTSFTVATVVSPKPLTDFLIFR